jgi:O-methyltransferase
MKNFIKKIFRDKLNLELKGIPKEPFSYFDIDPDFNKRYGTAQKATQMQSTDNVARRERHYTLTQLLEKVDFNKANVAECGTWRGLSSYQISDILLKNGFKNKFYVFDSFEGLSDFEDADIPTHGIKDIEARKKHFACDLDVVQDNLQKFNFIDFKQGWIPHRFPEVENEKFAFVHIDVDLYQPIKDSLEFFYPRMIKGGIIVLDDYGANYFPGAKKAVDEFLADKEDFFLSLPSQQAFIIKDFYKS